MIYPYAVKANGCWYAPGQDVPTATAETDTVSESANQSGGNPVEEVQPETVVESAPTKRGRKKAE